MSEDSEGAQRIDLSNKFLWCHALTKYLRTNLTPAHIQVDLSSCHLDEAGTQLLIDAITNESTQIRSLSLAKCRLTVVCTQKIFQALPKTRIEHLIMDGNVITQEACHDLRMALTENPPLTYLSMKECTINCRGCAEIAQGLRKAQNCRFLLLDSNCIFLDGARQLALVLPETNLVGLSIADNQVWEDGTKAILEKLHWGMTSLDLSYNAVDLTKLSMCLKEHTNLRHLAITGCKVNSESLQLFLTDLGPSHLETFIVEGLNYKQLPISWPRATEYIWSNKACFDALVRTVKSSRTLTDLRLGFLDLDQVHEFVKRYQDQQITRPIVVTMSDFGKTRATWIARFQPGFPSLKLEAPSTSFEWAAKMTANVAPLVGPTFRSCVCSSCALDSLIVRNTGLTDDLLRKMFDQLRDCASPFVKIDLTENEFTDMSVDTITEFFRYSYVEELILENTKMTKMGFQRFFRAFARDGIEKVPKAVSFSFEALDGKDAADRELFKELAGIVGEDCPLEKLKIRGPVGVEDVKLIVDALTRNRNLRELIIELNPMPNTKDGVDQQPLIDLVGSLHQALTGPDSTSRLSRFEFAPAKDVFSIGGDLLTVWGEIEDKLEENKSL